VKHFDKDPVIATLNDAKVWLRGEVKEEGAPCPCCGQLAKVYRRALNASMAYVLMLIYRHHPEGSVHIQKLLSTLKLPSAVAASGDYAKLRYWGFLEQQSGEREDGSSRNGYWQITEAGKRFVLGESKTASHAVIYNDKLLRLDNSDQVDIREVLGKKFRYDELMRA
jgi:hypothetical protein